MRNAKDFINRVVNKMGYSPDQFTVVEDDGLDDLYESIELGLDDGMVFVVNSCVPNTDANAIVLEANKSTSTKVITADIDNGVSIIIRKGGESDDGLNIQPLGVINSFLNELLKPIKQEVVETFTAKGVVQPDIKEVLSVESDIKIETERISLKDYYRLNLPDNKIGRKSDETLIRELKEAGFEV